MSSTESSRQGPAFDEQPPVPGTASAETSAHPSTVWEAPAGVNAAGRPMMPAQWGNPVAALVASLGSLFAGYLLSLVLVLLGWAGLGLMSDGGSSVSDAADQVDLRGAGGGVGATLRLAVHAMNMALGSRFVVSARVLDDMGQVAHASIVAPLLVLTVAYVGMAHVAARRCARQWGVGSRGGSAVMSLVAALTTAAVAMLVGRLCAFGVHTDEVHVLGHTASAAGFLGVTVLSFLATWSGLNRGIGRSPLGDHPLVRELGRAGATFALHMIVLGGLLALGAGLYVVIDVLRDGGVGKAFGVLLAMPLVLGNVIAWGFGQASLASINMGTSSIAGHSLGGSVTLFTYHWWVTLLIVLAALCVIVLAAMNWSSRRRVGRVSQQAEIFSWAVLPVTYVVGGLVLLVVARVGVSGSLFADGDSHGAGVSVHLSAWTPLLLALLGLVVDVVARYLAPLLLAMLPPALARFLPRGAAMVAPSAHASAAGVVTPAMDDMLVSHAPAQTSPWSREGAEPTRVDLAQSDALTQPIPVDDGGAHVASAPAAPGVVPPREPMSPEARRRLRRVLIAAGVLVGLLVAFAIVVAVLNATVFTAKHKAQDVLGKVSAGDASAAIAAMGPAAPQGSQALLASGLYKNTAHRVSDYAITSEATHGGQATVHAKTRQDTGVSDIDMQLTRHGHRFGLFNNWQVTSMPMGRVALEVPNGVQKVNINGTDIDLHDLSTDSDTAYLPALPGSYTVKVPDQGKYFTGSQSDVPVAWSDNDEPTQLSVTLNDQFTKDLNAAVKAKVDACAKVQSATVDSSCPWSGPYWDDSTMMTPGWKIDSYPSFSVPSGAQPDGEGRYYVTADHPGQVELTYSEKDLSGALTKGTPVPETMDSSAYATIHDDQVQVSFS